MSTPEILVRRLGPFEAKTYRRIRLEALQESPDSFSSVYEIEVQRPIEHFTRRLTDTAVFAALVDGEIMGMAGYFREAGPKDRHKGALWGMYVSPPARRLGLGGRLVEAVLDHAVQEVEQIRLVVSDVNTAARALYERLGFVAYGVEPRGLKSGDRYFDDVLMVRFLKPEP